MTQIDLTINEDELQFVIQALKHMTYSRAAPIISKIEKQALISKSKSDASNDNDNTG
jgi:hypothetical protein